MIVVGADVHVRNSYLHVADDQGRRLKHGRIGNTLGELAAFLGDFEPQPMVVSLESTTNSRAVTRMLERYGSAAGIDLTVRVLDARKLRIIAESVCKNDKVDAAILAQLTASHLQLPTCYVPDDEVFALREHLRARTDLVRLRTMSKNRVHAVLHRRGVLEPKVDLFTKAGRAWLEGVELDAAGRTILDRYLQLIDHVNASIQASKRDVIAISRSQRWHHQASLLTTMPGVGVITAMTVLAELGDWRRFHSRAAVANYAGLVPRQRSSNQTHHSGHITRRGPAHLRHVLTEAAWVAIRYSPAYDDIYQRVKLRRGATVAIVAVARRMLEDMFTMLSHNTVFRHDRPPRAGRSSDQAVAPSVAG